MSSFCKKHRKAFAIAILAGVTTITNINPAYAADGVVEDDTPTKMIAKLESTDGEVKAAENIATVEDNVTKAEENIAEAKDNVAKTEENIAEAKDGVVKAEENIDTPKDAEKPLNEDLQKQISNNNTPAEPDRQAVWAASRPEPEAIMGWLQEYSGKTVASVNTAGNSEGIADAVKVAIRTNPGDVFSEKLIERDMNRIYETGYFYDIYPTFELLPEGVAITYHLLETPILTSIEIVGNSDIEPTDKLMSKITMQVGKHLNRRALHEDITAIQKVYMDDGYVIAKVNDLEVKDDGKLVIRINEGILEGIKVKGNKKTHTSVILREVRCKVGEPLNRNLLVRSYQRINNLNFFESVDIKPIPGVEPNAVVLEIDVKEKGTGSFAIGAGYSSADGFVGMISLGDRNFLGTGNSLTLSYEISGSDSDSHGWMISYQQPWLDKKETSMSIKVFDRTFRYNEYNSDGNLDEEYMRKRKGFEFSFGRPQSEYTSNYITIKNVDDLYDHHISDGVYGDRGTPEYADWRKANFGLTRSIGVFHVTDTRDNNMNPTSGRKTSLGLEFAGLGGDFNYTKLTLSETNFFKVGGSQVVAIRGEYGHSTSDMPDVAKFRIGGQSTIRGYRDEQFRGNSMILANIEYRFPLMKLVRGAIFIDAGSAWNSGWLPDTINASIGIGASVDTPIGLLRLDYGRGSQGGRAHFTVGNTF